MNISLIVGLMIPFTGTTLGAAMVFFMKNQLNQTIEKLLLGFAAGVMDTGSSGIFNGHCIFAFDSRHHTAYLRG